MLNDNEKQKLRDEHHDSRRETLKVLIETDQLMAAAQQSISEARRRLDAATKKYKERYDGPTSNR